MLSRLFRPAQPSAGQPSPSPIEVLSKRLEESLTRPLLRIPAEDLPEEIRALVAGLNARLDALASAEKEQQQFIADVSHELRTPLTILRGSLEVALEEERPPEEYREAIGNALLEVRHLTRLSQNLLFLTRGESGRVTLSFANLDLGKFAADVVKDLALASADRGIELTFEAPKKPVYVFADSGRLQQVMHNLLENAMRYTESGGRVAVRVEAAPGEALLSVSDTGVGIPEADVPYVFERFFRSKGSRSTNPGGSGLGLSIVRWIVEAHKGRVTVESQLGKGSTFTVRLPVI
ncbi:MAG TPA: HAMP domain-containing sensor histidine kinase [Thermoanaerobaculia bacterium]|jgi:signal transduction histidine kinase